MAEGLIPAHLCAKWRRVGCAVPVIGTIVVHCQNGQPFVITSALPNDGGQNARTPLSTFVRIFIYCLHRVRDRVMLHWFTPILQFRYRIWVHMSWHTYTYISHTHTKQLFDNEIFSIVNIQNLLHFEECRSQMLQSETRKKGCRSFQVLCDVFCSMLCSCNFCEHCFATIFGS